MKPIKFRAITEKDGIMVFGNYGTIYDQSKVLHPSITYLAPTAENKFLRCTEKVIPETVGQFTGLKDKYGVEIYEGDILKADAWAFNWIVQFDIVKARFNCIINKECSQNDFIPTYKVKVIGNVHQNPELWNE